jgi:RNA polymerase sigma factor (sigma-70 family)
VGEPETGQPLISDADLITQIRAGDMAAYGELYRRHVAAARGLARQLVRGPAEVDDVVAETFSKVLDLMRRGGGPQDAFRPYLLTAVRRVAYDRYRGERRSVVTDEIEAYDPGQPFIDPAVAGLERSLIARAFLSLPERWRAVLWHTEIEGAKPADVAPLLGLTANGVAALAYRAREGLRQAYLQMHLSGVTRQECRPVVDKLGAFVRGGLSAREAKVVSDHLDGCADCRAVYAELADVNVGLRGVVAPIFLGPVAAAYFATMAAKGSAVAWIGAKVLWLRHAPKQQQAAMAGGLAAAAAAIAVALALTGHGMPIPPKHHAAAAPPAAPQPAAPPPPQRHVKPAPPAVAPVQVHVSRPKPVEPAKTPPAKQPPPTKTPPPPPPPPVTLAVHVDPVGALLRGGTGMLTFTVNNTGQQAAADLSASVGLPPGVSFVGGGSLGMAAPMASSVPGGWSCGGSTSGARCTHGPLGPGQSTTTYLNLAIGPDAQYGVPPTVSVYSGGRSVTATGGSGVVGSGLPARFAASGRLDTVVAGNTLPPCWWCWLNLGWHQPSSSAPVALPGNVLWAGLYWAGAGYPSGASIDLAGPGGSFQTVTAGSVSSSSLYGFPVYQAYANVTRLVATDGAGTWQAQVPTGQANIAADSGWTLVVVTQDPAAPVGNAVVLDGAHEVSAADPSFHVPLNDLLPAGASAGIQVASWAGFTGHGDPGLASYRQTMTANPAVDLSATYHPYLVGVVAATTSADSTQSGPPPCNSWPFPHGPGWPSPDGTGSLSIKGSGWLAQAAGHPGWPIGGCGWSGQRAHVSTHHKDLSGSAHQGGPKGSGGHSGGPGHTKPGGTQPGNHTPGGHTPGGHKPGSHKPGGGHQPGPVTGRLPDARQLGDVRSPHRQLGVRPHAGRQQHVVRRPDQLGGRGGGCPSTGYGGHAGIHELTERVAAGAGNVHRADDATTAAVQDPGREVARIGQPDRPAGVAGGEHAAAPCQPGQPPRQSAHVVVRSRDQAGAHDQVPAGEGRRHRSLRT